MEIEMSEKIPKGWKRVKFTNIAEVIGGGTPSKSNPDYWNGDIDWLTINDFNKRLKYVREAKERITKLGLEQSSTKILNKWDIVISARGTVGVIAVLGKEMAFNQSIYGVRANTLFTFNDYVYYLLRYKISELKQASYGAVFDTITKSTFENIEVNIPESINEQKAIADVLSSIDDKIDLLHQQNKTLEDMAQTLFRKWFIEDAKEDWEEVKLGDFFPVTTGKKNANFCTEDGEYPFFTCSQQIFKAPSYSFEGHAILLAGNGDFNVKRYCGKFEAYQRTYVLIPYNEEYIGFLYTLIKYFLPEITGGYRGSVINFITKGMIENFSFKLPRNRETNEKLRKNLKSFNLIYQKIDFNLAQIRTLEKLRDTLLPKLMSGEVRVKYEKIS
ncbi:restriction endonuclease subunit S [Deferribacteraceae bacterium V6Fe1]|nr:restriction endonuclease subunit S [Deferribacteraceae bacterium V6Fe1]